MDLIIKEDSNKTFVPIQILEKAELTALNDANSF